MFKRSNSPLDHPQPLSPFERNGGNLATPTQITRRPLTQNEDAIRPLGHHGVSDIPPRIYNEEPLRASNPYTQASYSSSLPPLSSSVSHEPLRGEDPKTTNPHATLSSIEPDTTLGKGVSFKGVLTFERFLRIDGSFEGELVSEGKLHVGPGGVVKSNITLSEAVIEGKVEGNIAVTGRLELRNKAEVRGDIEADSLSVDEGVTLVGKVAVTPAAS